MSALEYSDISLIPNYSELATRSYADTSVEFGGRRFALPVIPANMVTTIGDEWVDYLAKNNYFYIMHRFGDPTVSMHMFAMDRLPYTSCSVGVGNNSEEWLERLCRERKPDYVTIDVAHGHHLLVKNMIKFVRKTCPKAFIIAGNIATPLAAIQLDDWGADAVKVGIGPGKVCSTFLETGFHTPMFSTLNAVCEQSPIPVIADGGIRYNGDIAKALVAGATMVMAGSIFANCSDSPAPINKHGKKEYWGSASFAQKGERNHVEGTKIEMELNPLTLEEKLKEIKQSLQSAISYAGGSDLSAFNSVKWTAATASN